VANEVETRKLILVPALITLAVTGTVLSAAA